MKRLFFFLAVIFLVLSGLSAETLVLDREKSITLALENNRNLQAAGIKLGTARRESETSWNQLIPGISGSLSLKHSDPLFSDGEPMEMWNFSGGVNANLPIQPGLGYSIKQAELSYESEFAEFDATKKELINRVEQEFYYLLTVRSNLEIENLSLGLAEKRYAQVKSKYEIGQASELGMLQAQVTAANQRPTYLTALSDYQERLQNFLILLGLDPFTDVELDGQLDAEPMTFEAKELIEKYLDQRSDIQMQRTAIRQMENNLSLLKVNSFVPSLSLSVGWSTSVADMFEGSSWEYENWNDSFSLGLSVSVPLNDYIPNSKTDISIKSVQDDINSAQLILAQLEDSAKAEIINLVTQLETSLASMEMSRLNVELSRQTYEMSEESYERGTLERLEVEDAQKSYLSAQQSLLLNQYTHIQGQINLRYALGLESLDELKQ